ncbi:hypothetical protein JAAARDRAFT_207922 [Jaapia argillacea MUCL 33604]|uniref:Aminoglycoside phosphotransferase domain-containing protein n=1 Tax=Jaapia argillacea MUCL 33604 TaxID=933084 RepID=A0A067Q053_9AGAM|nr:hypothetical protein JAAARDRAFT_207922 [Jaapia argillacea MUCL 33604]
MNFTMQVSLSDGQTVIARLCRRDVENEGWQERKFDAESNLMLWLQHNTTIPVPEIFHVSKQAEGEACGYIVMKKMPGKIVLNTFGLLSATAKLFSVKVPQVIGSTTPGTAPISLDVGPRIAVNPSFNANQVFATLEEFFDFLFALKETRTHTGTDEEQIRAKRTIDKLKAYVSQRLEALTSPMFRRCILSHDDLNEANILLDDQGRITSVLDWELHSTLPAVIGVAEPLWISYDDVHDPRFAPPGTLWLGSAEECARLRRLYEEFLEARSSAVLREGQTLRGATRWLLDCSDDPGCDRIQGWMTAILGV